MVPFLLPFAIGLMVVLAVALGVFLFLYRVATPAKALVRTDGSRVLLRGGAFGPASAFEELHMVERDIVVDLDGGHALEITLRPKQEEAAVRSIAKSIGCTTANDRDALSALLVESLAKQGDSAEPASSAQQAIDAVSPGFIVVSAQKVAKSSAKTE